MTRPLSSTEETDVASIALAIRLSMLELRDPDVLNERVSAAQATGLQWSNQGLSRRITQPWGRAIVNATAKSVLWSLFEYPPSCTHILNTPLSLVLCV